MKCNVSLWAVLGLLAGGCAQHQVSQGGAQDFEPLPLQDTASSDSDPLSHLSKRNLGKPIPPASGEVTPADDDSSQPSPDLIRRPKRYEAMPL
jgi:hypothetical protein